MHQIEDHGLYLINNHRGRCPSSMRDFVGLSGKGRATTLLQIVSYVIAKAKEWLS